VVDASEIGDDEFLYRRVPVTPEWYDPARRELKPDAFNPRSDDLDGISFDRARSEAHPEFRSIEEAAKGPSANGYYVAVFQVSELRAAGFTLKADPDEEHANPGHALLVDLTYSNRKDEQSKDKMVLLAHRMPLRVEGPFLA
jgi:hypothetical protein